MPQLYSDENLLRIQPLVHKILCRRKCNANADADRIHTKINIPGRLGDITILIKDHKMKLHTKYQRLGSSSFRQENF